MKLHLCTSLSLCQSSYENKTINLNGDLSCVESALDLVFYEREQVLKDVRRVWQSSASFTFSLTYEICFPDDAVFQNCVRSVWATSCQSNVVWVTEGDWFASDLIWDKHKRKVFKIIFLQVIIIDMKIKASKWASHLKFS